MEFLPFSFPSISEKEIEEITDSLRSGWLTTGPKVNIFEEEFAKSIGCKNALAVNSCTAALHLALEAIGLQAGDEVIVPTMTFAATAEVVEYFKAKPALVDCDKKYFNIDTTLLESKITEKTKAIIPVHMAGQACDMDPILELAMKYNLKVIEDAAHTLPTKYKGRMIGTIGDITAFSFYATKNITTGEGGMAVTNNEEYAERMRIMSLHGISRDAWKRYSADGSWHYEIVAPGFKYNMTDLAASLGIHQLKRCNEFYLRRKNIVMQYNEAFESIEEIEIPAAVTYSQHSWHLYIIKLVLEKLTISRDFFIEELKQKGIGTSVHFIPLHLHPYYRNKYGYNPQSFPAASWLYERIVSLPIYPKMKDEDVEKVITAVKSIIKKSSK